MTTAAEIPGSAMARRGTLGLGVLFGTMYFIQGIAEPTEGLIAQPVRALLRNWGHGATDIAAFSGLLALPWALKPLYGLLSDFVPLRGYRRKGYLLLTSAATALGLLALYVLRLPLGAYYWLLGLLGLATVGVAFSDVVVDALMVEEGRARGLTGVLQSIQWAANYGGTILTGVLGGYLTQHGRADLGFLLCAVAAGAMLLVTTVMVDERPRRRRPRGGGLRNAWAMLGRVARTPAVLAAGGFLFLWCFNPFSSTVLYLHMTGALGFSEQFYGNTVSILSVGAIAASIAYGFYCRRMPFRLLLRVCIVAGVLATVAYWALVDETSAWIITVAVGFTYMTANLIQFDLAARVCDAETAGTVFALLMALSNLSGSLSTSLGGYFYDVGCGLWGRAISFDVLVGIGALFTAASWLLLPTLERHGMR